MVCLCSGCPSGVPLPRRISSSALSTVPGSRAPMGLRWVPARVSAPVRPVCRAWLISRSNSREVRRVAPVESTCDCSRPSAVATRTER